jgi:hypothetical protein
MGLISCETITTPTQQTPIGDLSAFRVEFRRAEIMGNILIKTLGIKRSPYLEIRVELSPSQWEMCPRGLSSPHSLGV